MTLYHLRKTSDAKKSVLITNDPIKLNFASFLPYFTLFRRNLAKNRQNLLDDLSVPDCNIKTNDVTNIPKNESPQKSIAKLRVTLNITKNERLFKNKTSAIKSIGKQYVKYE